MPSIAAQRSRLLQCLVLLTGLLLMQAFAACSLYTVRPINQAAAGGQANQFDQHFDPTSYANSNWSSRIMPTFLKKAIDIRILLTALHSDSSAAQKQYAAQSSDGLYNYMVKGQGKVMAVDTSSRNGTLRIQLAAYPKQPNILLQTGPVILGTAIRDSVGFINFNQFTNQVQYAQVADALNARVEQDLRTLNVSSLRGKTVTFYGAFTFVDLQQITITPVKITPEGAGA